MLFSDHQNGHAKALIDHHGLSAWCGLRMENQRRYRYGFAVFDS